MEYIILVCGSRNFYDYNLLKSELDKYIDKILNYQNNNLIFDKNNITILHGGCSGADSLANKYAKINNYKIIKIKAEWDKYGKAAGPIRNKKMLELNPNIVIAFSSESQLTTGTKNTIDQAKLLNIPYITILSN